MTYKEIRTQFIKMTGRFDLVADVTDYVDNGANFFIQAGLRYLDRRMSHSKTVARYQKDIYAGEIVIPMQYCRVIREVWLSNADGKSRLTNKTNTWLRNEYGEDVFTLGDALTSGTLTIGERYYIQTFVTDDSFTGVGAASNASGVFFTATGTTPTWTEGSTLRLLTFAVDKGTPLYWAQGIQRLSPSQYSSFLPSSFDIQGIVFGAEYNKKSIMILPPPDGTFTLTVFGDFSDIVLSSESDICFWSDMFPDLLVKSAMMSLESFYRNTAGVNDLAADIDNILSGIEAEVIEQEMVDADVMLRPSLSEDEVEYVDEGSE